MRKGFFVTLALIMVLALFGSATVALGAAPQPMAVPTHAIDVAVGATTDGYQVLLNNTVWSADYPQDYLAAGHSTSSLVRWGNGSRFANVNIPPNATITAAYLTFTSWADTPATAVNTRIVGDKEADAAAFSSLADYQARRGTDVGGASNVNRTTAQVAWDNIAAWTQDTEYQSPDISAIVQEIVNQAGWVSGNHLVLFWDDHEGRSTAANGVYRAGWSYPGAAGKSPRLHVEYTVTPSALAVYRPGGTWFIDKDRDAVFTGADWTNRPSTFGASAGDRPLAIDWNGDGRQELAIFRQGGTWFIDTNLNGTYDTGVDIQAGLLGQSPGDIPVAIDWDGNGTQELAIFRPGGTWFIDVNRDGTFNAGDWTNRPGTFGASAGDVPLAIDWDGNGTQELAIFRPGGTWFIDVNRDGTFNAGDWTNRPGTFGASAGDVPLAVDWDGNGTQELAIFRPGGSWFIDTNRNGVYNAGVDVYVTGFGQSAGDIPLSIEGW